MALAVTQQASSLSASEMYVHFSMHRGFSSLVKGNSEGFFSDDVIPYIGYNSLEIMLYMLTQEE